MYLVVSIVVRALPRFGPRMRKVDDENELNEDEGQTSEKAEPHPDLAESAVGNGEGG